METLKSVFDSCLALLTTLWTYLTSYWGLFGAFVIGIPLLKKAARTFNKLKA